MAKASDEYMLEKEVAQRIIDEVTEAMKGWSTLVTKLNIPPREILSFVSRFNENETKNCSLFKI